MLGTAASLLFAVPIDTIGARFGGIPSGLPHLRIPQFHPEMVLCGAREQPAAVMKQAQFHQHVGDRNICPNIEAALRRASEIHAARAA